MYQKDIRGKGYFRKSKAYGLVCGITLFGALVIGSTVSADEVVTTVETKPVVVVNPNPATNLTAVQEAPSNESVVIEEKSGTSTGEIINPVISKELDNVVETARDAGVIVTQVVNPVVHENIESAQADLSSQIKDVKLAEEKQEANTTVIKEAVEKNADIDRQNEAEKNVLKKLIRRVKRL